MKLKPHTPDEKTKLIIEILKGERTINEIAASQRRNLVDFKDKQLSVLQQA